MSTFGISVLRLLMNICMSAQVIASHEPLPTLHALKLFFSSVCLVVSLQLVRSGKPLSTTIPPTSKWSLPSVSPQVCTQVWSTSINSGAIRVVTDMTLLPWSSIFVKCMSIQPHFAVETTASCPLVPPRQKMISIHKKIWSRLDDWLGDWWHNWLGVWLQVELGNRLHGSSTATSSTPSSYSRHARPLGLKMKKVEATLHTYYIHNNKFRKRRYIIKQIIILTIIIIIVIIIMIIIIIIE